MKNGFTRREALGLGLGAAALGAYGIAAAAGKTGNEPGQKVSGKTDILDEYRKYGEDLESILLLRSFPIAVKMLEKEEDIPDGVIRPTKDLGHHLAQCQAFAMSRRDGTALAMLKKDHWCPTAVMAYGLVKKPDNVDQWSHPYDTFEYGKYIGVMSMPLKKTTFIPDVVILYANPAQMRGLLLSMKIEDVPEVNYHFFPPSFVFDNHTKEVHFSF